MKRFTAEFFDHADRVFSRCDYRAAAEEQAVTVALRQMHSGIGKGFRVLADGEPLMTQITGAPALWHARETEDA